MSNNISNKPLTDLAFADLDLAAELQQGLNTAEFTHCTPIQAATLPVALQGMDVAGQAQTGTGKTAAFLLVVFNRLLHSARTSKDQPRALIIAPTRELAIQIHRDASVLGSASGLKLGLCYGGVDYAKQRQQFEQGVDVLIGTPGRLIDYFRQRAFGLKQVEVIVLDEADRMFDLGFIRDIRFLLRRIPKPSERQGLLFSATLSHRVMELAYEHMNDPQLIKIETDSVTADNVKQLLFHPANHEKLPLLVKLIAEVVGGRKMVFVNRREVADYVSRALLANGIDAGVISGQVKQRKRQSLLTRFQEGELEVLVATDVAARGLHIEGVTHVFNYDLPQDAEDYVHRVGRTARLGASGHAISFACEDTAYYLPDIEAYIGYAIPTENYNSEELPGIKHVARRKRNSGFKKKRSFKRSRGSGRKKPATAPKE